LELLSDAESLNETTFGFPTKYQQSQQYKTPLNTITLKAFLAMVDKARDAAKSGTTNGDEPAV
jgi:hypothetical protein